MIQLGGKKRREPMAGEEGGKNRREQMAGEEGGKIGGNRWREKKAGKKRREPKAGKKWRETMDHATNLLSVSICLNLNLRCFYLFKKN